MTRTMHHQAVTLVKIANQSLIGLDAAMNYQKFNKQHHDPGRALSYSLIATSVSTLGSLAGGIGGMAMAGGLARLGLRHALVDTGLRAAGTIIGGAAAAKGINSLYENIKPIQNAIDYAGDQISQTGYELGQRFSGMAKSAKNY